MGYNNVKLLSEHNQSRIFVDGTEIKSVTRLDVHRDADSCKTEISIDFECDLDTEGSEQQNPNNKIDYRELQRLAEPIRQWLLENYNTMCTVIIDIEKTVVTSTELSMPIWEKR